MGHQGMKMTFESSKNLSAVGALLLVIGAVAGAAWSFSGLLSLIGLILLLVGLKGLATHYKEDGIFNNALYSVIIAIVGCVVGVGVIAASAVSALAELDIDWASIEDWANVGPDVANVFMDFDFSAIAALLGALLIGLVIFYVVTIIAMFFFRKSMNQLSAKSGVSLFSTAGLLMLIGAIIPVIGLLLIWIGAILVTVAFFQMKEDTTS
ncbi:MAG: hypothetical protein CW716_02000 [Candidatus Bathyarchaeum sp.]|nr:MAG: hypothetical protein CW716_02000 [Candidatus Bathyarchaeum sp.]